MDRRKSFAMSNPADTDLPPMLATPCGLYRHYKGGWYQVIDSARCSETLQGMTLYRALYGGFGLWVRPAAMFSEYTGYPGKAQARFVRHEVTRSGFDRSGSSASGGGLPEGAGATRQH
jgi:hypothetical protein